MKYDVDTNFFEEHMRFYNMNKLIKRLTLLVMVFLLISFVYCYNIKKNNYAYSSGIDKIINSQEYNALSKAQKEYTIINKELDSLSKEIHKESDSYDNNGIIKGIIEAVDTNILINLIINDNKINLKIHLEDISDYNTILSEIESIAYIDKTNSVSLTESGVLDVEFVAKSKDKSKHANQKEFKEKNKND